MQTGFQLIELMVVVALVGILGCLALPSFNHHVLTARRLAVEKNLLELSTKLEQAQIENNTLNQVDVSAFNSDYYRIALKSDEREYLLSAAPQGKQREDACGVLAIDSAGLKLANGKASDCWR